MKKILGVLIVLMLVVAMVGCSDDSAQTSGSGSITMGRVNYAAHGDKSFAVTVVAMDGDTIAGVSIDEFQFMGSDVAEGVPNSDGAFGESYPADMVLGSKTTNSDYYSEHMAEEAGSTVELTENYAAIEAYATGKTISELEEDVNGKSAEEMTDAVSGATLADTKGYLESIIAAAKNAE